MTKNKTAKKPVEKRSKGEKFTDKYGVSNTQIYRGDPGPDRLVIPGPDHFLYDASSPTTFDEVKVRQIDADGHYRQTIEVWTDPDNGKLYVVDGREGLLCVREVNRRRAEVGKRPIEPQLQPLSCSEKEAVARISIRNFHRRQPPPSAYAINILQNYKAGWMWEQICHILHVESENPEAWCRRYLPLAHCIPEVRAAFDAGKLPLTKAKEFGGGKPDGSEALGKRKQLDLLEEMLAPKEKADKPRQLPLKKRERIAHAMTNGGSESLTFQDKTIAEGIAAGLALASGDMSMLDKWPDISKLVEKALSKKVEAEEEV